MKTNAYVLGVVLACGLAGPSIAVATTSAETVQRTVNGTVVATNVEGEPPVIVIEVLLPNEEELIVGARVPADTQIMKGKQAVQLADIKIGEAADITYLKTPDGLIAQSIHVR